MPVDNRATSEDLAAAQLGDSAALGAISAAVAGKQDAITPAAAIDSPDADAAELKTAVDAIRAALTAAGITL